jgi:hypothetical protein
VVAVLVGRDLDGGVDPIVGQGDEVMLTLEDTRDGLHEGIVLERVLDPATDPLDQLEEVLGLDGLLADEVDVLEEVVVPFLEGVDVHGDPTEGAVG